MENGAYCCACGNKGCLRIGRCQERRGDNHSFFLISLQPSTISQMSKLCFNGRGRDRIPQCSKAAKPHGFTIWVIVGIPGDLCYPV